MSSNLSAIEKEALQHVRANSELRRLSSLLNDIYGSNRRCLNCDFFNEAEDRCSKYGTRPPSRVIAYGCPEWVDLVPF